MIQPPLWSPPAPFECPLKPTGLAKSGPQTRYPERRRDEKSLPFEVREKVDGLFHDRPSFKCTLWRGPRQSAPSNVKDRERERKERDIYSIERKMVENGQASLATLWQLLNQLLNQILGDFLLISASTLQNAGKSNRLCLCKLLGEP